MPIRSVRTFASGPNSYMALGRIVAVGPNTNSRHVTSVAY